MLKKNIKIFIIILSIISFQTQVNAQATETENVSDSELQLFVKAYNGIQEISQKAQEEMVVAVQNEGMEVERYNEILNSTRNPETSVELNSDEELVFNAASEKVEKIQIQAQQDMQEKIIAVGLDLARYQEIAAALQTDEALNQRFQELLNT
jgi:hypothetical protein